MLRSRCSYWSFFVDGVQVTDANIQDTVADSPMNNYAVLEALSGSPTLSNGNLKGVDNGGSLAKSSITMPVNSGKYYAEMMSPEADTF